MKELSVYFTDERLRKYLLPMFREDEGGTQQYTRRVMEWFVANYSKKNPIIYEHEVTQGRTEQVNILLSYTMHMNKYGKGNMDVYCRGKQRVYFEIDNKIMQTAVAQLNFVRWAAMYGVIDKLKEYLKEVESDHSEIMRQSREENKQAKLHGKAKKRKALSKLNPVQCSMSEDSLLVTYA